MAILAIDTCLQSCSAAVVEGQQTLSVKIEHREKGHAERLAPLVQEVITASDVGFDNISRIVVTVGPGSFTGVRVGLAFARGLAIGHKTPVVGVTTLEALGYGSIEKSSGSVAVLVDARRGQVYGQVFSGKPLKHLTDPFVLTPEQARKLLDNNGVDQMCELVGTGAALVYPERENELDREGAQPDPRVIASLGASKPLPERPPSAFYLRPADAKPARPVFN